MGELIGRVVHKLSAFDLHIKYKEQILTFYKAMVNHRDEANQMQGILNLPCMNLLYKDLVSRPAPGTAQTQSTSATDAMPGHDGDDEESKT